MHYNEHHYNECLYHSVVATAVPCMTMQEGKMEELCLLRAPAILCHGPIAGSRESVDSRCFNSRLSAIQRAKDTSLTLLLSRYTTNVMR